MRTEKINCKNCDQLFEMGFQFCPHCGQKTNDDLTIGVLFYNTEPLPMYWCSITYTVTNTGNVTIFDVNVNE